MPRTLRKIVEQPEEFLVPSITLLEVFKRIAEQRDESTALQYIAVMQQSKVVELDAALVSRATALGIRHKLACRPHHLRLHSVVAEAELTLGDVCCQSQHFADQSRSTAPGGS